MARRRRYHSADHHTGPAAIAGCAAFVLAGLMFVMLLLWKISKG